MIGYVPLIAGACIWLWLMHNRSLPLEGCSAPAAAAAALWFYALVAGPVWYWTHPGLQPVWEIRLLAWVAGFLWAVIGHPNEYTAPVIVVVAVVLTAVVDTGAHAYLDASEAAFGLVAWRVLLDQ